MAFLWIKAFHIIFVVTWFAELYYLPGRYVYNAMADAAVGIEGFKLMGREPYYGIMTPSAVLGVVLGVWLWLAYGVSGLWLHSSCRC